MKATILKSLAPFACSAALCLATFAKLHEYDPITKVGTWPGYRYGLSFAIASTEDHALLAGRALTVVDIRDPSDPWDVGGFDDGGQFNDIAISGHYAFVTRSAYAEVPGASPAGGLRVLDISDPAQPRLVAAYETANDAWGLAISGDRAYMLESRWDSEHGRAGGALHVLDISDPTNPRLLGTCDVVGEVRRVAVSSSHAYLTGDGLLIVDVSDPAGPKPAGEYLGATQGASPIAVTIAGNYAFVGYNNSGPNSRRDALEILDIGNPTQPTRVSSAVPGVVTDVKVSGDHAYVARQGALTILDIRDPANPTQVKSVPLDGRLSLQGNLLLSKSDNTLVLTDVSDPTDPKPQGTYNEAQLQIGITAVIGNHCFIAHGVWLRILDVSDPTRPRSVGRYRANAFLRDMVVVGHHTYLAVDGGWDAGGLDGLEVIDVSEPASPRRISFLEFSGPAWRLAVSGNRAYVSGSSSFGNTLHVIDISDPADPRRLGGSNTGATMAGSTVAVSGDTVYVAGGDDGLRMIDVSNPALPRQLGRVSGINVALFVTVNEGRAYVGSLDSEGSGTLEILDVSASTNPVWLGRIDPALGYEGADYIFVDGPYAYLTGLNNGSHIRVFDVSDPASPSNVAQYTRDYAEFLPLSVMRSGDHLYVADGRWSLQILRVDNLPVSIRLTVTTADGSLRVRWPFNVATGLLEQSSDVLATTWDPVPGTPQLDGDGYELSLPLSGPAQFFRLRKP